MGVIETSAALGACVLVLMVAVALDRRPYRPGKRNFVPIMIIAVAASLMVACVARAREGGKVKERWSQQITLRPAQPEDFAFCQRSYFEPMRATIEELGLDEARHLANFANRWQVEQVRIVMMCGQVIGWLQTASTDDSLFLAQLFIDTRFQRQGIGSRLVRILIEEAAHEHKAVTLGVVKTNPARRLYERLGFSVTHEDQYKFYMRRQPDRTPARAPSFLR